MSNFRSQPENNASGIVQSLKVGGSGGEAQVWVELRTQFPGIGGAIITAEGVAAARREQYFGGPMSGDHLFLKHVVIKKLDDYFYRQKKYVYSHIPRPFGSQRQEDGSSWYLYEWAFGQEGFSWFDYDDESGRRVEIGLADWRNFDALFNQAGIDVGMDVTDVDDGRTSKNVIHQYPHRLMEDGNLTGPWNSIWKRIDFGPNSCNVSWTTLDEFLDKNKATLVEVLRHERWYMLKLITKMFLNQGDLHDRELGRLDMLVGNYRMSVLQHYAMGFGPTSKAPQFGE